jgi:hypothetical protein
MTPPLTCPRPDPAIDQAALKDCGLYAQRALTADERLRRAVLAERRQMPGLAALVRAEAGQGRPVGPVPAEVLPSRQLPPSAASPVVFAPTQKGAING